MLRIDSSPHAGRTLAAFSLAAAALLCALPANALPGQGQFVIHTLPVGAGNCQVVECPWQNKLVVMDCGSRGLGDRGWTRDQAGEYVNGLTNAQTTVTVAISHPDSDHYNYVEQVLDTAHVRNIVLAQQLNNYSAEFQEWVQSEVDDEHALVQTWAGTYSSPNPEPALGCVDNGGQGRDVRSSILVVNAGATRNDSSMVVAMNYGHFQTVFTGDMTDATQAAIPPAFLPQLAATKFITGAHHGAFSHGSNQQSWADLTRPELVAFSSGTRFEHPRCDAVDTYFHAGHVLNNVGNHLYHCGRDGAYHPQQGAAGILVTNDNGLIDVAGNPDGTLAYTYQFAQSVDSAVRGSTWQAATLVDAP